MDKINNLVIGTDVIHGPVAVTAANVAKLWTVTALTQTGISQVLTSSIFLANRAATFTVGSGASQRTFLALNDGISGYSSTSDGLVEITGYSGALTSLAIV